MAKILLVEDDQSLREIYGIRLTAEGYEIVSAGDGEEALAVAVREKPDLIISDVMMPKISGFDMLDILRSTPETKDIKVIMMTALSSEDQRERGESLGANRFLVKSQVGIEDVVNAVHEVLDQVNTQNANTTTGVPTNTDNTTNSITTDINNDPNGANVNANINTNLSTGSVTQGEINTNQPTENSFIEPQTSQPVIQSMQNLVHDNLSASGNQPTTSTAQNIQTTPSVNPEISQSNQQQSVISQNTTLQANQQQNSILQSTVSQNNQQDNSQNNILQNNQQQAVTDPPQINTATTDSYSIDTVTDKSGMNIQDQMDQILGGMGTV